MRRQILLPFEPAFPGETLAQHDRAMRRAELAWLKAGRDLRRFQLMCWAILAATGIAVIHASLALAKCPARAALPSLAADLPVEHLERRPRP